VSAIAGGILADRFRRMKPFWPAPHYCSSQRALILILVPTPVGATVGFGLLGFGPAHMHRSTVP
jgi:hypothetical protein